jgi:hypothetical protein
MKRQKLNLILVVVAMALVAGVLLLQQRDQARDKKQPLTALKADAISRITLRHPDQPDIVLEKKDGQWALTAPVQVAADPLEVGTLTGLAGADIQGTIDPKQVNLADLGLAPPGYSVQLNELSIGFGGVEPLKYRRYLLLGDKVALIDDIGGNALDADYSDLVSKNLLPEGAQIEKLAAPGFTLTRAADGRGWTLDPADTKVSSDALQQLADAWKSARSMWNQAAPADAAAAKESVTLGIKTKDGGSSELKFGIVSRDPQLVLERSDLKLRYNLGKDQIDRLLNKPAAKPAPDETKQDAVEAPKPADSDDKK